MSESDPEGERSEPATEKKIAEARNRGDLPISTEVQSAVQISIVVVIAVLFWPSLLNTMATCIREMFTHVGDMELSQANLRYVLFAEPNIAALRLLIGLMMFIVVGGIISTAAQVGVQIIGARVAPSPSRMSPFSNALRIFGSQSLTRFCKNIVKFGFGIFVLGELIENKFSREMPIRLLSPTHIFGDIEAVVLQNLKKMLMLMLGLAFLDMALSRVFWLRRLRMSRTEVKEEARRIEGNLELKARLRSIRRARSRVRMLSAVERATLVVVNPTHYAVALRYIREQHTAPVVVAKGRDNVALKIRRRAEEFNIPVIENRDLARSMHGACVVDQLIPAEFYKAIAAIIQVIQRRAADDGSPR